MCDMFEYFNPVYTSIHRQCNLLGKLNLAKTDRSVVAPDVIVTDGR
jgi:hypothetical protein